MLTVSFLIILSSGAILFGLKLLYDAQQNIKAAPVATNGEPVARIDSLVLTADGVIATSSGSFEIPILTVHTDPLSPGDRIKGVEVQKTVEILALLKKNNVAVESVTIYNKDYCVLILPETIRVLYNSNSDARTLISSLQTMMAVFTIEGRIPEEIDFRFDKPVIRY